MMMFIYMLILLWFGNVVHLEPLIKNANNYGNYTLRFDHFESSKCPKSKNLTLLVTKMDFETQIGYINFTFFENVRIDYIKLQVYNVNNNKKSFLWGYKLNDPCKHYAFAAIIKEKLKANNSCLVKKGNYTIAINFDEVTHLFLGDSFFYGTYNYKADMTSKVGNIGCFDSTITLLKKI